MKAASQQGAVAACAAPVRSIAGQPGCAGRGSWLCAVLAKRAKQRGIYAGSTIGRRQPGAPGRREGGSRAWGSPTEARQDLAAVEAAACRRAVGVSGASGARRIVAALGGRSVAAVGRRWRSVRSGPVRSGRSEGGCWQFRCARPFGPATVSHSRAAPGAAGAVSPSHPRPR